MAFARRSKLLTPMNLVADQALQRDRCGGARCSCRRDARPTHWQRWRHQPRQGSDTALRIRYHHNIAEAYRQMATIETANAPQVVVLQTDLRMHAWRPRPTSCARWVLLNELVLSNLQPSPPGVAGAGCSWRCWSKAWQ